jgi:hypothetical protein
VEAVGCRGGGGGAEAERGSDDGKVAVFVEGVEGEDVFAGFEMVEEVDLVIADPVDGAFDKMAIKVDVSAVAAREMEGGEGEVGGVSDGEGVAEKCFAVGGLAGGGGDPRGGRPAG